MAISIGFGKYELTPPMGVELSGYGYYLERRCDVVQDDLYARTLAIKQGNDLYFYINCDLLGLSKWMVDSVRAALGEWYEVPAENVMMVSIHTHTGPTTNQLMGCGELDPAYASTVPGRLIKSAVAALEDMAPVTGMKAGVWEVANPVGYNRAGLPDHDTTAKGIVIDREGKASIAIASYACHPVSYGKSTRVSADYCGHVVKKLEEKGYLGMFLNGVCGDIDPEINAYAWGTGTPETFDKYAGWILEGFEENLKPICWDGPVKAALVDIDIPFVGWEEKDVLDYLETVKNAADSNDPANPSPALKATTGWSNNLIKQLRAGGGKQETIQVQILSIGDIVIVGYPYETYTRIGLHAIKTLPGKLVLPLGNANEPLAYIAVREALGGTSYGAIGSCIAYGNRFPFSPDAPDVLMEKVAEALTEMFG